MTGWKGSAIMNKRAALLILALVCSIIDDVFAQGTAFTYQGRLHDSGVPANGTYHLQFTVYDSAAGANVMGGPLTGPPLPVTNGLFTVTLDFGTSVFTGPARWLQISVRTNGSAAAFTALTPRQALTPTPYAIFAATASNVASGSVVKSVNTLKDDVTLAAGPNVTITPSGNTLTIASTAGVGGETNSLWSRNGADAYYNAGNVGIGTATPASRLEVQGAVGAVRINPDLLAIGSNGDGYELNLVGGVPDGSNVGGQIRLGGSSRGDSDLNVIQFKQNDSEVMRINNGGSVGIGTTAPQSKLHLYELANSVSHVIETGGGINAWARATLKNLHGQWDIGTSRGFNNDVLYIDRIGTPALEFQLSTSGLLGLGIEPQSKLHLYEPDNSVSQRIQTGGGVNAWTRLELINANGQWDIGTSRSFNGDQLYFNRAGTGIALGLQPNGDAFLAGNVNVGGNAVQPRDKGGLLKAMAKVNADGSIARQYNALGGTITATWNGATYIVVFPFQLSDRFVSVTPFHNESVQQVVVTVRVSCALCPQNSVQVLISDAEGPFALEGYRYVANEFFIFVY
jgi:hypothetical protein